MPADAGLPRSGGPRLQMPNVVRQLVPGGIGWSLVADAALTYLGIAYPLKGGVFALSDDGGVALAIPAHYYVVYVQAANPTVLRACKQENWAATCAAQDCIGLAYVTDHYDIYLPVGGPSTRIVVISDQRTKGKSLWVQGGQTYVAVGSDGNSKGLSLWVSTPPITATIRGAISGSTEVTVEQITGQPDQTLPASSSLVYNLWNGSSNTVPPPNWFGNPGNEGGFFQAVTALAPGPSGYWTSATPQSNSQQILWRQHFTLPSGSIQGATLYFSPGSQGIAGYVNGAAIAGFHSDSNPYSIDASHFLPGVDNVLAVQAQAGNFPPYAWIGFILTLQYA